MTKRYYPTLIDAQNDTNEITAPNSFISTNAVVYFKVVRLTDVLILQKYFFIMNHKIADSFFSTLVINFTLKFPGYFRNTVGTTPNSFLKTL